MVSRLYWGMPINRLIDADNKPDALRNVVETKMFMNTLGTIRKLKMKFLYKLFSQIREKELQFHEVEEVDKMIDKREG